MSASNSRHTLVFTSTSEFDLCRWDLGGPYPAGHSQQPQRVHSVSIELVSTVARASSVASRLGTGGLGGPRCRGPRPVGSCPPILGEGWGRQAWCGHRGPADRWTFRRAPSCSPIAEQACSRGRRVRVVGVFAWQACSRGGRVRVVEIQTLLNMHSLALSHTHTFFSVYPSVILPCTCIHHTAHIEISAPTSRTLHQAERCV